MRIAKGLTIPSYVVENKTTGIPTCFSQVLGGIYQIAEII